MVRRFIVLLLLVGMAGCAAATPDQPVAQNIDLQRYAGHWYVIANIPYFAERGFVGSTFDISFPDGKVRDVYTGYKNVLSVAPDRFVMNGYVMPNSGGAYWRESPFWPLYLSYLIVYVDPTYQTALVGYPGKAYGWVLSRSPTMSDADYQAALQRFAAAGYDVSKFKRVPQTPQQIGAPGFQ
jgi:apolipoprotein D and lipocalin family protein